MKMNLGYFMCIVMIGRWFGAVVSWRQVLEVVIWSSGWSLGRSSTVEWWCVLICGEVKWFVAGFCFG